MESLYIHMHTAPVFLLHADHPGELKQKKHWHCLHFRCEQGMESLCIHAHSASVSSALFIPPGGIKIGWDRRNTGTASTSGMSRAWNRCVYMHTVPVIPLLSLYHPGELNRVGQKTASTSGVSRAWNRCVYMHTVPVILLLSLYHPGELK